MLALYRAATREGDCSLILSGRLELVGIRLVYSPVRQIFKWCFRKRSFSAALLGAATVQRILDARDRCASSCSSIRWEMAVPRVWSVNPARLTRRNEPDSNELCLDSAFVSDDVHVIAAQVNKRHPRCVYGGCAGRVVPLLLCH